jgi:ribonuclease D
VHPAVKRNPYPFIKAIKNARPAPKPAQAKKRRLTTSQEERVKELLSLRDKTAERLGLEGFVVLTREQAERLARGEKDVLRPWQRLELGL